MSYLSVSPVKRNPYLKFYFVADDYLEIIYMGKSMAKHSHELTSINFGLRFTAEALLLCGVKPKDLYKYLWRWHKSERS